MPMFSVRGRRNAPLAVVKNDAPAEPTLAERALGHVDELYALARHMCGNPSDAEDLVQDTYARALAGATQFEDGTNLRAWLFRILRNVFIDQARRRRIVLEVPDDNVESLAPEHWDSGKLEQLMYLSSSELGAAIAALPIEFRFVVLLDAEGFSEAEMSEILRCPAGTVKSRLSRAKARLRAVLKEAK